MRAKLRSLRWLSLAAALAAWSCGGSNGRVPMGTGGTGGAAGAGGGGNVSGGAACVDRPDDLMRPPSGGLPCELIPPGVQL